MTENDSYVQVASFLFSYDAHILRGLLEAEEIEVRIFDEQASGLYVNFPTLIGGIKVVVPARQEEKAKSIVDDYHHNREEPQHLCPECGAETISRDYSRQMFCAAANFFSLLVGGYPLCSSAEGFRKCAACGYKW